jgi:hypothetical protein
MLDLEHRPVTETMMMTTITSREERTDEDSRSTLEEELLLPTGRTCPHTSE